MLDRLKEFLNIKTVLVVLGVIAALVMIFGVDVVQGWIEALYGDATGADE